MAQETALAAATATALTVKQATEGVGEKLDALVKARLAEFGESPFAAETKVELSARYALHGSF